MNITVQVMKPFDTLVLGFEGRALTTLSRALSRAGFRATVASGYEIALEQCQRRNYKLFLSSGQVFEEMDISHFLELKNKCGAWYSILVGPVGTEFNPGILEGAEVDLHLKEPPRKKELELILQTVQQILGLRKELEKARADSARQNKIFDKILGTIREAVFILSLDYDIQYCNTAACDLLDSPADMLLNRNFQHFLEDGYKILNHVYHQVMLGRNISGYRIQISPEGKESLDVSLSANLLKSVAGQPEGLIVSLENNTIQNELLERMVRKEKLATITQLSRALAHEIRNPINILSGRIQLLKKELVDQKYDKNFEIIERQIERVSAVTDELNKFNINQEETVPELFSLVEFLETFFVRYPLQSHPVQLNIHPKNRHYLIEANRYQFEDAFRYLVETIAQHLSKKAELGITVQAQKGFLNQPIIEILFQIEKSAPVDLLLEPFRLVSQEDHLSSFGVAIMQTIFSNYGGVLSLESQKKNGKIIKLQFPVKDARELHNGSQRRD